MRRLHLGLLALVFAAALCCLPSTATAETHSDLGYSRGQVFSGALRYLRIDLNYEITEQDADSAYLLFRFSVPGQKDPTFGAFEIVETEHGVRLWVKLPKLPAYHEQVLKDGLLRKLLADYGQERPKPPAAPNKPKDSSKPKDPATEQEPKPAPPANDPPREQEP